MNWYLKHDKTGFILPLVFNSYDDLLKYIKSKWMEDDHSIFWNYTGVQ